MATDNAGGEVDLDIEAQATFAGEQLRVGAVVFDADRLHDLDETSKRGLANHAGFVDGFNEARGRAIHDRHLGSVDFDHRVIDAKTGEGGQQMLDGRHRSVVLLPDYGAKLRH